MTSGAQSTQIVADQVSLGPSLDEVRLVATGIFWQNFPQLRDAASVEVQRRLGQTISLIEQQFPAPLTSDQVSELSDPDGQLALLDVLRSGVRTDDDCRRQMLARLLAGRLKSSARDFRKILYNEAIAVAPKLTANQLKVLGVISLVRNVGNANATTWEGYNESVGNCLSKLVGTAPVVHDLEHLKYLGCLSLEQLPNSITGELVERFPRLFQIGVPVEEISESGLPDEIRDSLFEPVDRAQLTWRLRLHPKDLEPLQEDGSSSMKEVVSIAKKMFRLKDDKEIYTECKAHPVLSHFLRNDSNDWIWNTRLTPLGVVLAANYVEQISGRPIELDAYFGDGPHVDTDEVTGSYDEKQVGIQESGNGKVDSAPTDPIR